MKKPKPLKIIAGAPERPLRIGDIEIQCYVLEDEMRVLSQRGLQYGVGLSVGGGRRGAPKIVDFLQSLSKKGLEINDLIARLLEPIEFQPPQGRTAYGYPATILADICNIALDAQTVQGLLPAQQRIIDQCRILNKGFAKVGIIALVDETTGYQRIREENALATILEKFIAKELQPWVRTYPYEFYQEIFRLKGWPGPEGHKRSPLIGLYTNDIVYARLAPGVLEELRKRNPTVAPGRRRHHHHQWFTPDPGYVKLNQHLAAVIALMKAAPNWTAFQRSLNRVFPKMNEQIALPIDEE